MKKLLSVLLLFFCMQAISIPLNAEQAFHLQASINDNHMLVLNFNIAPSYHLYRDAIQIVPTPKNQVTLGHYLLPQANSLAYAHRETYENHVEILVPLENPEHHLIDVNVSYQGCASSGYCFAPVTEEITASDTQPVTINTVLPADSTLFAGSSTFGQLFIFLGLGVLLAFTPCVLPMIPILSSIIIGHRKRVTTAKAFFLSLTYVLAMSVTYAVVGLLLALAGDQVQAWMQSPIVIIIFAGLFVLLAFSLFGFYELRLPARFENYIAKWSHQQKGGTYIGVAVMGVLSTLIVSPCVTAPLAGILIYIINTGDAVLGGLALFALGFGMGIPLLIVGTCTGRWLPRAGRWMTAIKIIFGVLLIATAIQLMSRIVEGGENSTTLSFVRVDNVRDLNRILMNAKARHEPVLLDFWAKWCESCHVMDHTTYEDAHVQESLKNYRVVRVDVTDNNANINKIRQQFQLLGTPTVMLINQQGQLQSQLTTLGQINADEMLDLITKNESPSIPVHMMDKPIQTRDPHTAH